MKEADWPLQMVVAVNAKDLLKPVV